MKSAERTGAHPTPAVAAGPIRILRIVTRMNIGGPTTHVTILSTRLHAARFSTCLVVGRAGAAEGDLRHLVQGHGPCVRYLKSLGRSLHPLADVWALIRIVGIAFRERPRIIHTHMAKAGALGRMAGFLYNTVGPGRRPGCRAALIHTFHGHVLAGYFSPHVSRLLITIERWLAKRTDRLVAVSVAVKDDLVKQAVAPAEKIDVIPLGLSLEPLLDVNGHRGAWRSADERDTLLIVWAGRLVPIKRVELFLEGLRDFAQRASGMRWRAIIAGDGECREAMRRHLKRLGLADCVQWVGWVKEMTSLYADADVVCLTSANEGTPVALIEAMAAGKPVIATGVGGVLDLLKTDRAGIDSLPRGSVQDVDGGWVVRSGDAEGLAHALTMCAQHPELRAQRGAAGRDLVRQRYEAARLVRDIETLYDRLVIPCRR